MFKPVSLAGYDVLRENAQPNSWPIRTDDWGLMAGTVGLPPCRASQAAYLAVRDSTDYPTPPTSRSWEEWRLRQTQRGTGLFS